MPPRKSNVSTVSNGADDGTESPPAASKTKESKGIEELSLPKSMIARLAKGVLPANTQIQKDALLALHKSATVFVSYIANTANENAHAAGKKTILPQDVMAALKDAELEEFLPRCEAELKKYNETQCEKRNTYRRKVKEDKAAQVAEQPGDGTAPEGEAPQAANGMAANGHANGDDVERPSKKLKGDDGAGVSLPQDEDADEAEDGEPDDDHEEDDQDDEVEDVADDDDDLDEDGDETMEDAVEEPEERDGVQDDEALDDADSD